MRDYVENADGLDEFYERLLPLLDYLLPQYENEGKAHLTIGIGCTGGRHRSVVIGEHLCAGLPRARSVPGRRRPPRHRQAAAPAVIHHVGYEVQSLARSARFYDAVFFALGGRRLYESAVAIGWGIDEPVLWVTARARPKPGYGHVALHASGRAAVDGAYEAGLANGGADDGPPGPRPRVRTHLLRGLHARPGRPEAGGCRPGVTDSLLPSPDSLSRIPA